jgi:opacity protein-like surface antigen
MKKDCVRNVPIVNYVQAAPDYVELQEASTNTTGIGMTLGVGLRVAVTRHLSIRPEIRYSDGTGLSSANLSQTRLSAGLGYSW